MGQLQQLCRLEHPVIHQELLGRFSQCLLEDLPEVGAVQSADAGNILNGDIVLEVVFDIRQCLVDIEVPELSAALHLLICCGAHQIVQEQIQMPDEVERRGVLVACDVQHFVCHIFPEVFVPCVIDGLVQ